MSDNYQHWVERVVGGRDSKPLNPNEIVKSSAGEPFGIVEFARIGKKNFVAEVGKKGKYYIYHFFPSESYLSFSVTFRDKMSDVLLELFKREDQIEIDWVPEMKSWAIRVSGWTDHIWGDDLALRVIERLDQALTEGQV